MLDCRPSREVSSLTLYPHNEVRPYVRLENEYLEILAEEAG